MSLEFDEYIESLRDEQDVTAHIELDAGKEIRYMLGHRSHFVQIGRRVPRSTDPLRLLDIGPTPFTLYLKQLHPHYDIWALDRTDLLRERFEKQRVHLQTCDLDNDPIPFEDGFFDVVIFTEVLEHIFAPPSMILRDVRRILRPGGKLILGVPNIARLDHRIKLLLGRTPLDHPDKQLKKDWVHGHGHIHEYTMREIASILRGCDFEITSRCFVRRTLRDGLRTPGSSTAARLMRAAYHAAQALCPSFGDHILLECRK